MLQVHRQHLLVRSINWWFWSFQKYTISPDLSFKTKLVKYVHARWKKDENICLRSLLKDQIVLMPLSFCLLVSISLPSCSSPPWQHLRGGLPLSHFWPVSCFFSPPSLLLLASTSFSSRSLPYCAAAAVPPPPLSPLVLHFPPLPSFSPRCICLLMVPSFFPYIRIIFIPSLLLLLSSSPPRFLGSSPHYITVLPTSILAASTVAHTHTHTDTATLLRTGASLHGNPVGVNPAAGVSP